MRKPNTIVVDVYPGCVNLGTSVHYERKDDSPAMLEYLKSFTQTLEKIPQALGMMKINVPEPRIIVDVKDPKPPEVTIHNKVEPAFSQPAQIYIKEENRYLKYFLIVSIIFNVTDLLIRILK